MSDHNSVNIRFFADTILHLSRTAATDVFTISPSSLTLQPDETSANISITVVDNQLAEDNRSFPINANSQFGTASISITIQDNDRKYKVIPYSPE